MLAFLIAAAATAVDAALREALEIKTYYEQRWLEEGKNIHFMEIVPPSL